MRRILPLLVLSLFIGGCDLVGGIFKAGLMIGLVTVVLIVAVIAWLFGKFKRGPDRN